MLDLELRGLKGYVSTSATDVVMAAQADADTWYPPAGSSEREEYELLKHTKDAIIAFSGNVSSRDVCSSNKSAQRLHPKTASTTNNTASTAGVQGSYGV